MSSSPRQLSKISATNHTVILINHFFLRLFIVLKPDNVAGEEVFIYPYVGINGFMFLLFLVEE